MRSRGLLMFALCTVLSSVSYGQTWPFELWHEGKIILSEGDTLNGLVKYDLQQDLVQFDSKTASPLAFTARKVVYFEIFDRSANRYRRFFSLPFSTSPGYKTDLFFELLEEGKLTLLAREFLEYQTQSTAFMSVSRLVLSHRYFFLKDTGDIEEFIGKRSDLLQMMGRRSEDVDKFMRQNRLTIEDKLDFARIVDYYNSL